MSRKVLTHKHHIIPRHMGGTDDPSNLIELSIPEHAEAHRILYETYGKLEDLIAWRMLSGRKEEGEAARLELSKIRHREHFANPENREIASIRGKKNRQAQIESGETDITREKRRVALRNRRQTGEHFGIKNTKLARENYDRNKDVISLGRKNSQKWRESVSSEETRKKKSVAMKEMINSGTFFNEEHRRKISESLKGRKRDTRKIFFNGNTYNTIKEAREVSGLTPSQFSYILNNPKNMLAYKIDQ